MTVLAVLDGNLTCIIYIVTSVYSTGFLSLMSIDVTIACVSYSKTHVDRVHVLELSELQLIEILNIL